MACGPVRAGSTIFLASTMIQATSRTCSPNEARQLIALVTSPPMRGPAAAPSPPAPLTTPKYFARDLMSGNTTVMRM